MSNYITRSKVIEKACKDMLKEMYFRAQPPVDIDTYADYYKRGILDKKKDRFYEWHYLPIEIEQQITEDYLEAYGANDYLKETVEWLKELFKDGGHRTVYKDLWNEGKKVRTSEKTEKLDELIGKENAEKVYKLMDDFLGFYKTNADEMSMRSIIFYAPTSNPKTVIEKWGPDFKIDDSVYKGYDPETWDYSYKDYYKGKCTNEEFLEENEDL